MNLVETGLPGLTVVQSAPHRDFRGSFTRLFCVEELQPLLGSRQIVQVNHSVTTNVGTVRGLHFQSPPHAEMKMVRCVRGRVWDVAVDLRSGSPTFLEWHAEELSHDDARMMVVPEGFAHGFQALEPESEVLYLTTAAYCPGSEGGLRHDDTRLAIAWPLPIHAVSPRDLAHPLINPDFGGVVL
ncbi:dTDP-4-dehydrorhamnose 3,5-epimerase [Mycobacterium sp. GA-1841]|uniref:dTDP-4-dehydrorhamnose 3,5-epimerase family protein n=1 Tax=Mycobacterium sp. GA-1841 TaxID=1834154 RepID=UPI00096C3117|nr:dTDP-4-dehydrorhamnose 3,5-epimerase family protein [Mycobacterium sp. GA-1841]OMC34676.1 dTDP-4-dehydrorhamnose 3,5-epimerase [Mycobacterium sp. GA-1841]